VLLEDILRKGFSNGVSDLILGSYWEDLDKPISYMFAKVMVIYVDVLGTRAKLGKPGIPIHQSCLQKLCSIHRAWYR
jgi:hypothetical protein